MWGGQTQPSPMQGSKSMKSHHHPKRYTGPYSCTSAVAMDKAMRWIWWVCLVSIVGSCTSFHRGKERRRALDPLVSKQRNWLHLIRHFDSGKSKIVLHYRIYTWVTHTLISSESITWDYYQALKCLGHSFGPNRSLYSWRKQRKPHPKSLQ